MLATPAEKQEALPNVMFCSYNAALILKVLPGPPQRVQSHQIHGTSLPFHPFLDRW
jgi:hypothetical protein